MTEQQIDRERLRADVELGKDLTGSTYADDSADYYPAMDRIFEAVPQLLNQLDQAEARIKAVRDLHRPYGDTLTGLYICTACDQSCPCPTTRALEG